MIRLAMRRRASRKAAQQSGTALSKYERLESTGLWRAAPGEQRREVIVHMGQATLIFTDPKSDTALTHWSLPAVLRLNPGVHPAIFAPGEDSDESVEIEDEAMLSALRTVQGAVRAATPHPGRLRSYLIGGGIAFVATIAIFVLPHVLVKHTAAMVPAAKRTEIGMRAFDRVTRLTGAPCKGDLGLPALANLSERIFGPVNTPILYILPEGLTRPGHLPGDVILLPRQLLEQDGPDALAGAALAESLAASQKDPMLDVLEYAGLWASFDLLTSGDLPQGALDGFGEAFLREPEPDLNLTYVSARFHEAQVPLGPYALWRNPENLADWQAADPYKGLIASPLLSDDDWIALQSVCSSEGA